MTSKISMVIHGGAGNLSRERLTAGIEAAYRQQLTGAVQAGHEVLRQGGGSREAVIAAIMMLEDSALFNAGHGAVLDAQGMATLDASIMDGVDLNAGAVAGVQQIKNPIVLAARVLSHSPHVLLAGAGAEDFARAEGFEFVDNDYFVTQRRRLQLRRVQRSILGSVEGRGLDEDEADHFEHVAPLEVLAADSSTKTAAGADSLLRAAAGAEDDKPLGTVGAVAIDRQGNITAGTSTGGTTNKQFGRIGDSPLIGAGTYAENQLCGISATGHGEYFIRAAVAFDICARVRYQGLSLQQAADAVVKDKLVKMGGAGGIIGIDSHANPVVSWNTPGMYRASINPAGELEVAIFETP